MKLFISWSGDVSGRVARVFRDWIPYVLPGVDPYVSSEDVHLGSRWANEIAKELDTSSFGLLCVTRDNFASPWMNFEAGALSRSLAGKSDGKVIPILFGLAPSELEGPLSQFQAIGYTKEDLKRLVMRLNAACEREVKAERLSEIFDVWWPKLHDQLQEVHQLVHRKILWAFEREGVPADEEVSLVARDGFQVTYRWVVPNESPPPREECDVIVHFFCKTPESSAVLRKLVDFAKAGGRDIPVIVYTGRASGDGRLADLDMAIVRELNRYMLANMPETLKDRLKSV